MKRSALWIALLALLLLAGCVKTKYTAVSAQKFAETAERYGAATQIVHSGDAFSAGDRDALIARVLFADDAAGWSGIFWEFDSEQAARSCFARLNGASEPAGTFSPGEEYDRFEITLSEGAQPVLKAMRVRGTVLLISSRDDSESRGAVTNLLLTLRYN